MSKQRPTVTIFLISAIFVGVVIAVAILSLAGTTGASSSKYQPCIVSTTTSSGAAGYSSCLQLTVALNSTSLAVGQHLRVSFEIFNRLPSVNNVTSEMHYDPHWGVFPLLVWGSGCWGPEPLYFIILQGNYSLATLSNSDPPVPPQGICEEGGAVSGVAFRANSDVADVIGGDCTGTCNRLLPAVPVQINGTVVFNGFYNTSELKVPLVSLFPISNRTIAPVGQTPFLPGVYTLAVSSVWGQESVLHFSVS